MASVVEPVLLRQSRTGMPEFALRHSAISAQEISPEVRKTTGNPLQTEHCCVCVCVLMLPARGGSRGPPPECGVEAVRRAAAAITSGDHYDKGQIQGFSQYHAIHPA